MMRALGRGAAVVALLVVAAPAARAQDGAIQVGRKAPAVVIGDLDGKPVDLGAVLGKRPVFLEFWATWCSNCEELLPRVKAAASKYGNGVAFYGINVTVNQTRERVRRYLAQHQPPYITLYDDKGVSARAYEVPSTSYIVIIDKAGTVAYTGVGGDQAFETALAKVAAK